MLSLQLPSTLWLGFFTMLLAIYYLSWRRQSSTKSNKTKKAPQPAGAWPIIGHLHLLARGELPHRTFGAMADKYGPAFMIRLGTRQAIVVSNSEIAKECLTIKDRIFATRPNLVASKLMGYNSAMIGLSPHGVYWRVLRKIIALEVLSHRRMESLKHVWEFEVSSSVNHLHQSQSHGKTVLLEMDQWFGDLTLNIAVKMVAGKRFFSAHAAASHENESRRCQKATRDFFRLLGQFVVSDSLPFLGWLDLGGYQKEMKSTAKELDSILQKWLDEHKQNKQFGGPHRDRDFMDVMLSLLEDASLSEYDTDTINKATCFAMIVGGTDTTKVTLTWALTLLLNNPDALKKSQDELDIQVGKHRHVEESDIKNLVYLQAIVKETLRLYPAAPLLAPHEATEDCTVAGYHVRAGTRLILNAWKIQRDPLIWPNPSKFLPERFLNKDVDVKGQQFELIPFGSGRRVCPGIALGLQVVSLTLARLLHEFEISIASGIKVDMTESGGLVTAKATPLEVLLTPRLSF